MKLLSILSASLFAGLCVATPLATPHRVHEKRSPNANWAKKDAVDRRVALPMRIALKQSNIENGHEWLHELSHPASDKYGQHWSAEQVAKAFAPRYVWSLLAT